MKLLQVAASIAPRDGGPTTGIIGLNQGLNTLGVDALILSTDADGPTDRIDPSVITAAEAHGARASVYRRSRPRRLKNSWAQGRSVWQASKTADVVHIHGVYLAHSVWGYLGARWHGRPHSIQPHGALEPYQRKFGRLHKGVWDSLIGRRILRTASVLVAASDAEAKNLRALVPGSRVIVMPLGVRPVTPAISAERRAQFARWLSVPRPQRVLFLGRLASKKRPDLMIEAWQQTTGQSQLAVVGPAEDWTQAELQAMATPEREAALTVTEAVDPAGVAWLMSEAGIFVLPSENENFGITVAEAMLHGCAVITTAQTAAGEHLAAAGAGIVLPDGDLGGLTRAIDSFLGDSELTTDCGRRGSQYAAKRLTWRAAAERLRTEYGALPVGRRRRGSAGEW